MRPIRLLQTHLAPLLHFALSTVTGRVLLSFLLLYALLLHHARTTYYRDPTSVFFDPQRGYRKRYSLAREAQSAAFIRAASAAAPPADVSALFAPPSSSGGAHNTTTTTTTTTTTANRPPKNLCVAIATIARPNARYFYQTIGSVLEGLTAAERAGLDLVLLIAHTDPSVHPAYTEPWLDRLPDAVVTYASLPDGTRAHLAALEAAQTYTEKALFDYTLLLSTCLARSDAPFVATLEDDVLAARGWLPRTLSALGAAENRAPAGRFLYLRLFHTEEFLGWNAEYWPSYLLGSLLALAVTTTPLLALRGLHPASRRVLTPGFVFVVAGVVTPAMIVLFFLAGRVSVLPLAPSAADGGIVAMPRFGCCSQGLVYPRAAAEPLVEHLRDKGAGFVDVLVEQWAASEASRVRESSTARTASGERVEVGGGEGEGEGDDAGGPFLPRYAVVPSVLQHVGASSSKGDDFGSAAKYSRSVAEKIWSFGFEEIGVEGLR
ncbi:MAG: hypothetical protein M1833_005653 [Piccolia ochrophora]|nr:MAG: hypothetical protein M1833_005653 [Piccolia ochrophora]